MIFLPPFNAADFSDSSTIDNEYFSLPAGTITSFSGEILDPETGEGETERNDLFATCLQPTTPRRLKVSRHS
jgi:hypothetical protein